MKIQFNSDNNITAGEGVKAPLIALIEDDLSKFSDLITRVEVHLSDENSNKNGLNDKRCMMEARLQGRQPIAVTNLADTEEQAVSGAIDKLTASLETILGRLRDRR
jgi:ribosome-associated translation inhibitor RaiA